MLSHIVRRAAARPAFRRNFSTQIQEYSHTKGLAPTNIRPPLAYGQETIYPAKKENQMFWVWFVAMPIVGFFADDVLKPFIMDV